MSDDKFLDLQNGFYNALSLGLGYAPGSPFQIVQPSPPLLSGSNADQLFWNYFNNIPPSSLSNKFQASGGAQFLTNYSAFLSALEAPPSTFYNVIGPTVKADWIEASKDIPYTVPLNQFPQFFRSWAMRNGHMDVATTGASAYARDLLNPIFAAQNAVLPYKPSGTTDVIFAPDYSTMVNLLSKAPSRQFDVSAGQWSSDVSSAWATSSSSGFFGLWGGSSTKTSLSTKFASSGVSLSASFDHVLPVSGTPGGWYNSAAMGVAFANPNSAPWQSGASIDWDDTFDPSTGNLARFAVNLIVVSGMEVDVISRASFSTEEQTTIHNNAGAGLWPFYSSSGNSGSNTDVKFDQNGNMHVTISSQPNVPIVIGVDVLPVEQYIGHAFQALEAVYAH